MCVFIEMLSEVILFKQHIKKLYSKKLLNNTCQQINIGQEY